MPRCKHLALSLLVAFAVSACGRDEPEPDATQATEVRDTDQAAAPVAPAAPVGVVAEPGADYDRPLEVGDLDAYARGVAWEIEALGPKVDAVKAAREKNDDAAETMALLALSTPLDEEAAKIAGTSPERFRHLRNRIDEVLAAKQMGVAMKPQIEAMEALDMSGYSEEQKEQARRNIAEMKAAWADPYAKLPPDVAAAMKAREAELEKLRHESLAIRLQVL